MQETTATDNSQPKPPRAAFYVDGYNLYCGICDAGLQAYKWLDLGWLCKRLLFEQSGPKQVLQYIKYFTAWPEHKPDKEHRHKTYVSAIRVRHPFITPFIGCVAKGHEICDDCNSEYIRRREKGSDVALAVEIIDDAHRDRFDVAHIISGDSDFVPIVKKLQSDFGDKTVKIWLPPARGVSVIKMYAKSYADISAKDIKRCQMPDPVVVSPTARICRPVHRRWPKPPVI